MTSNLAFIAQGVSRASLYSSRLPQQCTKIQHLQNNLVSKADTNMLFIGQGLSYALYENTHANVSWIEDGTRKLKVQPQIKPYNLIIVANNQFSVKMLPDLKNTIDKNIILAVVNSRMMIAEKLLERSIGFVPDIKISSKVEIYDRNNSKEWDNGILIYDLIKTK